MPKARRSQASGGLEVDWRVVTAVATLVGAFLAIQAFYRHPTYGTGVAALLAAIQAGEVL